MENLAGVAIDTGYGPDRSGATSIGGRFLRVRWHLSTPPGAARWVGYGADAQVITVGFDSLDAGLAQLVVVAGAGTHAGVGFQFEAAIGGATGDATLPFAAVGAFFAPLPYFAIGFSGRVPLVGSQPQWLESSQVGGRVVLPWICEVVSLARQSVVEAASDQERALDIGPPLRSQFANERTQAVLSRERDVVEVERADYGQAIIASEKDLCGDTSDGPSHWHDNELGEVLNDSITGENQNGATLVGLAESVPADFATLHPTPSQPSASQARGSSSLENSSSTSGTAR